MDVNYSLLSESANILVVDDTIENLSLLSRLLKDFGFVVRPVPSGRQALMAARSTPPDLILLDISMPEMDGFEVCRRLKDDVRLRDIPVLFISALSATGEKVRAFEVGGVDYITKPFQIEEVKARIDTHLKLSRLQKDLSNQVQRQVEEISNAQMALLFALTQMTEMRDDDTGKHVDRVQMLCRLLAHRLAEREKFRSQIDDVFIRRIYLASALHDIGKVGIPDHILLKKGRLTVDEFTIMRTHTLIGYESLAELARRYPADTFINLAIQIARSHHEKWDGSGYPDGLREEEIPLCARIMAVADVYDALRSKRVYKPAFSHRVSREILKDGRGKHFDPNIIDVFLECEFEFQTITASVADGSEGLDS